jgi:hypothetical protein
MSAAAPANFNAEEANNLEDVGILKILRAMSHVFVG